MHVRAPPNGPLLAQVSDEGAGVPKEERERVFEMHVRLDAASVGHRGYGFGLASCRLAASALGGRVWVEDNVPAGATFVLELPISAR